MKLDEVGWQVAVSAEDAPRVLRRRDGDADDRGRAGLDLRVARFATRRATRRRRAPLLRAAGRAESRALAGRADAGRRVAFDRRTDRCRRCSRRQAETASGRCASGGIRPPCMGASATFPSGIGDCRARIRSWAFTATAGEDARFRANVYRLPEGRRPARVLTERGRLEAHVPRSVRFPWRRLAPGRYVYSIRFRAEANRDRKTRLTSRTASSSTEPDAR